MKLIDGKAIAAQVREEIAAEIAPIIDAGDRPPHLAAILVGEDGASQSYVAGKERACQKVGMTSSVYRLPETVKKEELYDLIDFVNRDREIDGLIVQLPLPDHIDEDQVISLIRPEKDVDGFHPINVGRMVAGMESYLPATPKGILELIKRCDIETSGKNVVVLGRSHIVGTPMSILLSRKSNFGNATVTLCHSRTKKLESFTKKADILIAAIGQPEFVTADMVKKDAVIIDVGIHRIPDKSKEKGYRITGDVNFDEVSKKASWITPVPGGVGPMTIAGLLMNTLQAFKKNQI